MVSSANEGGFWKERRILNRDDTSEWMITKDTAGNRIFDPEKNKENVADYYENLYSNTPSAPHPYHEIVAETIKQIEEENQHNQKEDDTLPSKRRVSEVIRNRKTKKATTDWKNIIIKKGGEAMVDLLMPVIEAFWREEKPPKQWNQGIISNIWKGKGDRENMINQRGQLITSLYCGILWP